MPAQTRLKSLVTALLLLALLALSCAARLTPVAVAERDETLKAPSVSKPDKPDKPDKGPPGNGTENGNGQQGLDARPESVGVTVPQPVAAPVQSTPAPAGQAAAPAAPAQPTGDRPARARKQTRTIRMGTPSSGAGGERSASDPRSGAVAGAQRSARAGAGDAARPDRGTRRAQGLLAGAEKEAAKGSERRKRPSGPASGEPKEDTGGSPVVRTVKDIVEVVPGPIKLLLAALAAASALLGGGYLLAAGRARRLVRQRAELLQEVGLLQTALLPPVPATVGAVRTSVAYRPSDGPGAGGDFYDAMTLSDGRAAFILGDVSGHGRQALARTAFARFTLRAYLEAGLEPRTVLQVAGRVIDQHLDGHFATVVIAVHDPKDGSLTYACAGHPAPIVVGPTRPEPILAASSPPIGLELRTGVRQTTLPLPPGSVVCLYTDGLAEARTEKGILGRPRLADIVAEQGRGATASGLLKAVASEARLVTDDMATVLLSPTAGVTSGGFRSEQLEVDLEEAESGLAERFLEACEVRTARLREAASEARSLARSHGGAVIHVGFGTRGAQVEVLPRNVASIEAASQHSAAAALR